MLYPNEYIKGVEDLSIELLKKNNIKGVILDVDNTLIDFDKKMPDGIEEKIKDLKQLDIKFCILSNSNKVRKIKDVAQKLDIPFIYFAKKPLKCGFEKARKILGLEAKNIAVIGDQIFTDIIGANRCKMFSVLVDPIEEKDYLVTKIKRPIENLIINHYLKMKEK